MTPARLILLLVVCAASGVYGAAARSYEVMDTGVPGRNEVFWIDDTRVLFPGFDRDRALRPVLLIWDHASKRATVYSEIAELGYVCYSEGYIRYSVGDGKKRRVREGKLGSELEREWPPTPAGARTQRNEITCRDFDLADVERVYPGFLFPPLRDGDGFLGWRKTESIAEANESPLYFLPPGKRSNPIALPLTVGEKDRVSYSQYLRAYVIEYTPSRRRPDSTGKVRILYTNGTVTETTIPAGPWLRGSMGYTPAKKGIVMSSPALGLRSESDTGHAGVYLVQGDKVELMVAGFPTRYVGVSPDGCKAAAVVRLSKPTNVRATLRVIDMCKG